MKNHQEIEQQSKELLANCENLCLQYPGTRNKSPQQVAGYLFIRALNTPNENNEQLFQVLNTKKENGEIVYVTRNKDKTLFFDYKKVKETPWITIKDLKQRDCFSYKEGNFSLFHGMYNGKEEWAKELLNHTQKELENTLKYFRNLSTLHLTGNLVPQVFEDLWKNLSKYLNYETKLALTLSMDEENAKLWLEKIILEKNTKINYAEEITKLFDETKPLLIKKNKDLEQREAPVVKYNYYNYRTQGNIDYVTYFEQELEKKIQLLEPHITKLNLYMGLNENLVNGTQQRKMKI